MTNKFSSFLTQKGRWLTATLFLLFSLGIGNAWGDDWTAANIVANSGAGTTKNHVTVSSPGITSTSSAQIWKDGGTAKNENTAQLGNNAASDYNKTKSFVEIKADKGYAVGTTLNFRAGSNDSNDKNCVVVWWTGKVGATFTGYQVIKLNNKNISSSTSANYSVTLPANTRVVRIYRQVGFNSTNTAFGTDNTLGDGKAYIAGVTATSVVAPEIGGDDKMLKSETVPFVGYPSGGTWAVKSGSATINSTSGALTSGSTSGEVVISYTVDDKSGTHTVTVLDTDSKTLCWDFTQGVLPTATGVTAVGNGEFNSMGYNLATANTNFAYIDVEDAGYIITAAHLTVFPGGTGSKNFKGDFNASLTDAISTTAGEYWQIDKSISDSEKNTEVNLGNVSIPTGATAFRITKGSTGVAVGKIYLTVKKAVACTVAPTVSATTKGATTSTTQVVNCAGISSLGSEGCSISSYGFVYGTGETPNIDDDTQVEVGTTYSTINTAFAETTLTGLTPSTTYYVRAYATNGSGTAYGSAVSFTTSAACTVAPTVSAISKGTTSYTTQVMNCAGITAIGSAGCAISSYGFVYGKTEHPTTANSTKEVGTSYTVVETAFAETTLTGLTPNTTYYVRAYATNEFGTAYSSNELSFNTLATIGNVAYIASSEDATNDAINALRDAGYNVTVRTKAATPDYTGVDLVVLDETLSWGNSSDEVGTVISANVPILNLKAFFYTKSSSARWGWGSPVNPSSKSELATLSTEYCNTSNHPIFEGVTITAGAVDMIGTSKDGNNLQGVTTNTLVDGKQGYTLATSATGITCIHELTPAQRGVSTAKYLLIALSSNIKDNLSDDAKKMIVNAAKYLVGSTAWTPVESLGTTTIDATGNPFSEGATMTLTASATGATASTTYAWYKGDTWAEAEAAGTIQAAKTAENSGHIYTKTAASEDAGTYWCVMVKSTGCEATASVEVSVLSCTKPGTPANLAASNLAYTTADLSWDAADNADGYKISIIKKEGEDVILDWTDNTTTSYAATGLTQGTEYTFKVKAKGASGYCEFGLEATEDFTTTAPSVANLVTIDADYTFTPSVNIPAGTLSADSKFFAAGTGDCDMNDGKMRVKENRALAFKVADNAKIKVTFATKSGRQIQLGTALSEGNYDTYGSAESSPYTFDVVTTGGVVYLTAHGDQLYFSKLEIIYPRTVTYDLNGGTGTQPTESAHYEGDKFTVHNGVTGITAPSGQEFDKWKDQDNADVAGGAEYTMPAKAVTLTAQWRAETVKYTVTYDLDDYTAGVAPTETDKAAGDVFAIKAAPSRDGYAFMGWLCNIDAQTYQATDDYTMTAAATTFTAVWKQEFQVTYNRQGHGDPIAPQIVVDGAKVTKPADPEEMLYEFGGWYKEAACTNAWDFDNDVVTEDTELFAKWTEFDGCAYLAPVASGDALAVGDNVNLKSGSLGGTVKVAGLNAAGKIAYNAVGLAFTGGGGDSIRVTLENKMMAGTKITVRLQANDTGNRGLKLRKLDKTEVASLGWSSATVGAVESFTYTVGANDGLDGKKAFILSRNNTVYLKYISVENCAPEEFVVTYKDGSTTMGTEDVYKNAHPTATGIVTKKLGYSFLGWSETDGGELVDLDDITITAAKDLYAKYEAIDCPTSGTVYKFVVKDELASETLPAITDKDMSSYVTTTGHGYLTYTATSNNKAVVNNDGTIQMKDATAAYLKVELDCALGAGDQIRAHITSNPMRVQVGTTYDSNKDIILAKDNYVFVDITSDMVGKQVLYITRSTNGNANIADFEVKRPAKYTVSFDMKDHGSAVADLTNVLEGSKISAPDPAPTDASYSFAGWYKETTLENAWDFANDVVNANTTLYAKWLDKSDATLKSLKYGETEIIEVGTYTYNIDLPSKTASVPALTAETSNPNAAKLITNAIVFNVDGEATSTVVVTPEVGTPVTYTVNFTKLPDMPLLDVTASTTWNFANAAAYGSAFTDEVLANFPGMPDASVFDAQRLQASGSKIQSDNLQGTPVKFHTTTPGKVRVEFSNTGSSARPYRYLVVNGVRTEYKSNGTAHVTSAWITVPAGDVILEGECVENGDGTCTSDNLNFYKIEFNATPDLTRPATPGRYGTICYSTAGYFVGGTLYEIAYYDATAEKIFLDEIINGEMIADRPYVFLPNDGVTEVGMVYSEAARAELTPGKFNGLHGTYVALNSSNTTESPLWNNYLISNNQYICVTGSNCTLSKNRAYIVMNEMTTTPTEPRHGRRRVAIGAAPKTATDIENIVGGETPVKLMINGQMYILRGEKLYDATGRLVK